MAKGIDAHIRVMAMTKKTRSGRRASYDPVVVYRGIKIPPMTGWRSPLAQAICEDLLRHANPLPEEVQA